MQASLLPALDPVNRSVGLWVCRSVGQLLAISQRSVSKLKPYSIETALQTKACFRRRSISVACGHDYESSMFRLSDRLSDLAVYLSRQIISISSVICQVYCSSSLSFAMS